LPAEGKRSRNYRGDVEGGGSREGMGVERGDFLVFQVGLDILSEKRISGTAGLRDNFL